jgi:hypothetical protein
MKKLLILSIAGALIFPTTCSTNMEKEMTEMRAQMEEMRTQMGMGCHGSSGRKATCQDTLLSFDLLYWHPKTDLTEIGGTELISGSNRENGSHTPAVDFDWEFGFKAGIGYHFDEREWDIFAEYTRVDFNTSFSFNSGAIRRIYSNFGEADSLIDFVKGSHRIDYQTATVELGRQFVAGQYSRFKPAFGAKATWINQIPHIINHETGSTPSISQHVYLSEKTQGIGPLAMMYSNWCLCNGWSLYADGGFSLLFTRYRGRMSVEGRVNGVTADPSFRQSNKEDKHYVTPNAMLGLGLSYERFFSAEKQHVVVSIGYESQYYFNQSYLMQNRNVEVTDVEKGAWLARNLAVYGATLSASLEF